MASAASWRDAPAFTLQFDSQKLRATLRTAALAMPAKEGRLQLSGMAGMQSARGGAATLTALELVLGIDNVIFISILAGKLPKDEQERARRIGLMAAMIAATSVLIAVA